MLCAEEGTPPRARVVAIAAMAIGLPSLGLPAPLEFLLAPPLITGQEETEKQQISISTFCFPPF